MADKLAQAVFAYQNHCDNIKTVILGSVDAQGNPLASYAPYVMDERRHIYVLLSGMSPHSQNLETNAKASALFIEDESATKMLFARKRLTFECQVTIVDRADAHFEHMCKKMAERHGAIIERMQLMPDFRMFELTPLSGRFVIGLGAAFEVTGDHLEHLKQLGVEGGGNPHAHSSGQMGMGHGRDEKSSSRLPAIPRGVLSASMKKMIMSHMNENHMDALCNIVMAFANREQIELANMVSIDAQGMDIEIQLAEKTEIVRISFEQSLSNAEEAHAALIQMARVAKEKLS